MEVLLVLGLIWLILATGVVGLCAAAQQADRQAAHEAPRRPVARRRARPRRRGAVRRPGARTGVASFRHTLDRRS
ncbi:MAG: hypothetical protein ACSLFR_14005 [Solirubrobacteraceae bacterium]